MTVSRLTIRRLDPPSPDVERRLERAARGGAREERARARRAARAREEVAFLAAGPAGFPFSRRA